MVPRRYPTTTVAPRGYHGYRKWRRAFSRPARALTPTNDATNASIQSDCIPTPRTRRCNLTTYPDGTATVPYHPAVEVPRQPRPETAPTHPARGRGGAGRLAARSRAAGRRGLVHFQRVPSGSCSRCTVPAWALRMRRSSPSVSAATSTSTASRLATPWCAAR